MAHVTLTIHGMTCDHCQQTVEQVLAGVDGTFGAAVFRAEGEAEVDYDPARVSFDLYRRAVEAAGYGARIAE